MKLLKRTVGLATLVGSMSMVGVAAAEEPLTTPSLETEGKPLNAPAPTATSGAPRLGGISLLGGVLVANMGPINDRLAELRGAYPNDLPSAFPILGAQGFGLFSRFLVGGSGAAILSRTVDAANDRQLSMSGGWGTFDFGYQLLRVNGFMVAPVLSLGGYATSMTAAQKGDVAFNQALSTNRGTTMTNDGLLTGLSVVAKVVVIGRGSQVSGARSGWSLGLRLGGLYGFPIQGFRSDAAKVTGEPSFGLRGGYAALSIGRGSW